MPGIERGPLAYCAHVSEPEYFLILETQMAGNKTWREMWGFSCFLSFCKVQRHLWGAGIHLIPGSVILLWGGDYCNMNKNFRKFTDMHNK